MGYRGEWGYGRFFKGDTYMCGEWEEKEMSREEPAIEEKPSSLIAMANDLVEMQNRTLAMLEEILGPQPASESEGAQENPRSSLSELKVLLARALRNAKDTSIEVGRICNTV